MDRPTRWSYSSLSTYEECPAKWKYSYVDGLEDPPSPAMERGIRLHSLCESVLNDHSEVVPVELAGIERIIGRLRANDAQSEKAWRLNSDWLPVESGSWVLGIIDVHFLRNGVLHIYDFKSGRPYPSHKKQLELYSLIGLRINQDVDRVECGAIYIDTGKIGYRRTMAREEAAPLITSWTGRAARLFADEELAPKPGSGCYWCAYKDSLGGPCVAWRK